MDLHLKGKLALVSGSTAGIGHTARRIGDITIRDIVRLVARDSSIKVITALMPKERGVFCNILIESSC